MAAVFLGATLAGCAGDTAGGAGDAAGDSGSAMGADAAVVRDGGAAAFDGLTAVPAPAGPGSGEPNLVAGPAGVYLSWLERTGEDRHALRLARWEGEGWGGVRTVIDREGLFVNWADFPSVLALDDGTLAAHWLQKSGAATYAYDVRMALSRDGGESWSDDILPHRDGIQAEHGFVSLFPSGDSIGAVWLDGRETPDGRPMTLASTTIGVDGGLGPELRLDDSVCDCCQTGAAVTAEGPVVAYRDRSPEEVRDIYVTRRVDGEWGRGRPIHEDGWTINACPVNGPAVAAEGRRVAVAWFTGATGDPGVVRVAFSDDAGATFTPPVRADDGRPIGRVGLVLLPDGDALLSWLERTDDGADVRVRRVGAEGVGPAAVVAASDAARASGFPRMVRNGDRLLFAWTEPGPSPRVRTAIATVPRSPDADGNAPGAGVGGAR